jgi:Mn2+/Fe2+ NRAMP family transporter
MEGAKMTAFGTSEAAFEARAPLAAPALPDENPFRCINGALGTIAQPGEALRSGSLKWLKALLAILGPGVIVMVGDNDAGAFGTYTAAGQNYGTHLLWTLVLLIPVLYVNQEMVLRLGAVTGTGHARLILKRFGRFWGAFSVIDLFLLNALTVVTEFIGISLGLGFLGVPKLWGVASAAILVMAASATGNFRRFERFALFLCFLSLLLIPVFLVVHPPLSKLAEGLLVPTLPQGGPLGEVIMLIVAIVGTTIAPWQLFFQQSYVIDKGITARFIPHERADLAIGIALAIAGAVAMMAFTAAAFAGHGEFGHFRDAGGVALGIAQHVGALPAVLFAIALIDASLIGAAAVSLATAYALADILELRHSLDQKPTEAKAFYGVYCGLIALAAAIVLTPGAPLGLLTNLVQSLAGVLLPSATVFLLLLCNDAAVLGPWVNGRALNLFTSAVIAVLILLSTILTAAVLFPAMKGGAMLPILAAGAAAALATVIAVGWRAQPRAPREQVRRENWRMPPIESLPPARLTPGNRVWLAALRLYLAVAGGLVLFRIAALAIAGV